MKTHRTLRAVLGIAVLLFSHQGHSQQVQLRGSVAMHNSKYQTGKVIYVQNTYLSAPFTKPALSDVKGAFTLEFEGLDPGMAMKIEASKQGLEIVNTRDLDEVVIGRRLPLRIYVTQKGNLAKAQMELFKVSQRGLFASRDQMIARLRGEKAQSEAAMEELQKRFGQELADRFAAEDLLRKKVEEQQKQLPKVAMELAKKNLDNASALYIEAYKLFQEGKILEVIALLDQEKLQASRQQTKQATAAIKKEKALLAAREEQNQRQIQQLIATYTLKADALALEFRYTAVATQYQEIIGIHLENELPNKALADWYDKLGHVLLENGAYPPALEAFQRALAIVEKVLDATHPSLANFYNNIGLTYWRMGRYEEALSSHQEALAIVEEVLDAKHPRMAQSYNNIGLTYSDMGRYKKALKFYQKALVIYKEVFDTKSLYLAMCYNNMATVYWGIGSYKKALELEQKALAIREEDLDAKHPHIAFAYNNIGSIYSSIGRYEKALEFHQKALVIREEVLDAKHPSLAISYANIGVTYSKMGTYEEALEYLQKALSIREEVLEAKHPDLAFCYHNVGMVYWGMGSYKKALKFLQKGIIIKEEVLDAKRTHLAISYTKTAATLTGLQQYKTAQEYLQKALAIYKENKHPDLITIYGQMGLLQLKLGKASKARKYLILYNELAKDKDKALGVYYEALYHTVIGDYSKALSFLEEAVAEGYQNKIRITQEQILEPLYKEPRYQVLVEKLLGEEGT